MLESWIWLPCNVELTIWLAHDVFHGLVDYDTVSPALVIALLGTADSHTAVDSVRLLVWDLNAKLLQFCEPRAGFFLMSEQTSSIAITTSTVSKLSSPRSLVK